MSKESKFKVGMIVKTVFRGAIDYKIIKVLRNEIVVECDSLPDDFGNIGTDTYTCKKSLFEVVE